MLSPLRKLSQYSGSPFLSLSSHVPRYFTRMCRRRQISLKAVEAGAQGPSLALAPLCPRICSLSCRVLRGKGSRFAARKRSCISKVWEATLQGSSNLCFPLSFKIIKFVSGRAFIILYSFSRGLPSGISFRLHKTWSHFWYLQRALSVESWKNSTYACSQKTPRINDRN